MSNRPLPSLPSSPTGHLEIPVCLGDLPTSDYCVKAETITFDIVKHLTEHEKIPGVLIYEGANLIGAIPRSRFFERLGRLYGVDLFIRKPVRVLNSSLNLKPFMLPDHLRVHEGVQYALARPMHEVYDPIVVVGDDKPARMLDMHTLLFTQSQIISIAGNLISILDRLERTLYGHQDLFQKMNRAIDLLGMVVPHHYSAVLFHQGQSMRFVTGRGFHKSLKHLNLESIIKSTTISTMLNLRQSLVVNDVSSISDQHFVHGLGKMYAWMGIPLFSSHIDTSFGLISLARFSQTSFTKDEKDIADEFSRRISQALEDENGFLYDENLLHQLSS